MRSLVISVVLLLIGLLPTVVGARSIEEDVDILDGGEITSWGYSPVVLTVPLGSTITWRNTGDLAHSVTSRDQLFDSRLLDDGRSWSYTFDDPGTYRYFCVPHPWMKGTVVVTVPEEPTPRPTSTPSPTATPSTTSTVSDR
jgi:plastocyanin